MRILHATLFILLFGIHTSVTGKDYLEFKGIDGPGKGKHIVLLAGDEEYRSEEALPLLAGMLASQGFDCTVLFSMDKKGETVDPTNRNSLSNPEALASADAIVMSLRFRHWSDATMQKFEAALLRGVPIVALRTSTHAFFFADNQWAQSHFANWAKYHFKADASTGWENGFGREVLGETWVSHHGKHKVEGTRSSIEPGQEAHPILRGVGEIFGTTDVYEASPKKPNTILLRGIVTETLEPDSRAVAGEKNNPMQAIAWTRLYENDAGKTNRVFTTTMGSACELVDPDLRRLVINGIYWGLEIEVPEAMDVSIPDSYNPTPYGFKNWQKGLKPEDFRVK